MYPGEEMTTVDLTPGGTICSLLSTPNTSCTATITNDCSNYNISITLSNDIGSSQPVSIIFNCELQPLSVCLATSGRTLLCERVLI